MIFNIYNNEPSQLPQGKADFLLAGSVTRTCEIEGITQAGIPTMIPLTPTLDAEFITNEKVFSLGELAETPTGVPSPAIITRAVENLVGFSTIEVLDLGLEKTPQNTTYSSFGISPSESITKGANIDVELLFNKGLDAGHRYELKGNYLILGESTPSGTTTATTTALACGYDVRDDFSSSFKDVPNDIRDETINKALSLIDDSMSLNEKLSLVSDNMLIFCAGFIISAHKRFEVVLGGGTQMASCLLLIDKLKDDYFMSIDEKNITLATTSWVANDKNSDIKNLLSKLSFTPNAIYSHLSFENAEIPVLKKYDEGEAKEGVGAGASLAYGYSNGLSNSQIVEQIEYILYTL